MARSVTFCTLIIQPTEGTGFLTMKRTLPPAFLFSISMYVSSRLRDIMNYSLRKISSDPSLVSLQLEFKECFHEHQSTRTVQVYHKALDYTYEYVKLVTYNIFVFVFGMLLVIFFGTINGMMAFCHVWVYGPIRKLGLIVIYSTAPLLTEPMRALLTPLYDIHARIFRQIRIQFNLTGLSKERCNV